MGLMNGISFLVQDSITGVSCGPVYIVQQVRVSTVQYNMLACFSVSIFDHNCHAT